MAITLQEAKHLTHGTILYHVLNRNADGTPQRWRVSGKVKTWKRTPEWVEVPIKCGLYGHDYLTAQDLDQVSLTEEGALGLTDFGARQRELYSLTKHQLGNLIAEMCGMWTNPRNRTKESLIGTINLMEEHHYDKQGSLKPIVDADNTGSTTDENCIQHANR